jgi:hypothetical protein
MVQEHIFEDLGEPHPLRGNPDWHLSRDSLRRSLKFPIREDIGNERWAGAIKILGQNIHGRKAGGGTEIEIEKEDAGSR